LDDVLILDGEDLLDHVVWVKPVMFPTADHLVAELARWKTGEDSWAADESSPPIGTLPVPTEVALDTMHRGGRRRVRELVRSGGDLVPVDVDVVDDLSWMLQLAVPPAEVRDADAHGQGRLGECCRRRRSGTCRKCRLRKHSRHRGCGRCRT